MAILALGLCLWTPLAARAQTYLVHTYTADDGLPSSEVFAAAQDELGRMWFATRRGLVVYDGLAWRVLAAPAGGQGWFSPRLRSDGLGTMWVTGTSTRSLVIGYDASSWNDIAQRTIHEWTRSPGQPVEEDVEVTAFAVAVQGGAPVFALGLRSGGLLVGGGEGWELLGPDDGLPDGTVRGIATLGEGFVLVTDHGLATVVGGRVDPSATTDLPVGTGRLQAVAVAPVPTPDDASGEAAREIWVLAQDRLLRRADGAFEVVLEGFRLGTRDGGSGVLLPVPSGCVFFGRRAQLFHLDVDGSHLEILDRDNGLVERGATDLLRDREGNTWVTSVKGVSKIVSQRFASYDQRHGLLESEVSAACERRPGEVVLGHNHGLTLLDDENVRRITFSARDELGGDPPRVMDLLRDRRGAVWVATLEARLGRLESSGLVTWFELPPGTPERAFFSLAEDADGSILVGGGSGLYRFRSGQLRSLPWDTDRLGGVRRLHRCRSGRVLAASSEAGLVAIEDAGPVVIPGPPDGGGRSAYTVFEDSRRRVWVGAGDGLYVVERNSVSRPRLPALEPGRPVYQITEDGRGWLWFGTDDGVVRWDGSTVRPFTVTEGLAGRETNRAAGLLDSRQRLWIGTDGGVSVFRPWHDAPSAAPPAVLFLGVDLQNGNGLLSGDLELDHGSNTVGFHFAALSFVAESSMQLRCRLGGFDPEWSAPMPAHQRSVRYTNLGTGSYTFLVQARNVGGAWSEPATSGEIVIVGPWWTLWWLDLAVGLALASLGFAASRIVVRWRYTRELEREVERRRVAEDRAVRILEKLEESRADFAAIVDRNVVGLLVIGRAGTVAYVNQSACTLLGRSRAELEGRQLEIPGGLDEAHDVPVLRQDGSAGTAEMRAETVEWKGEEARLVVLRDVTEQRRAEAQLRQAQKLEAVGQLAGGVAHDFNNLLQALLSSVESLRIEADDAARREELLTEMESHVQQGSNLTRRLLLASRKDVPHTETLDLNLVIHDSLALLRRLVRENIRFAVQQVGGELLVTADRSQLGQVLTNLVVNACDAMPDGGRLIVRTGRDGSEWAWFEVQDTGVGIPESLRARIFEPFFSTKDRDRGTGLGLSVVDGIVTRHRGRIEAESREGEGSRFRVMLPAATFGAISRPETPEEAGDPQHGRGERILLVEDDAVIRRGLAKVLRHLGYDVVEVGSAEDALTLPGDEPFDLLLADLVLPGERGDRLAVSMRERWPDLAVVIMSGYSKDETTQLALQAEAASFLFKPFEIGRLTRVLREALEPEASGSRTVVRDPLRAEERAGGTVLLVEDDPDLARWMTRALERAGLRVIPSESGGEALGVVADPRTRPDLVITEAAGVGLSGVELLRRCRQVQPDLPFLFCSGKPRAWGEDCLGRMEGTGWLQKPFRSQDLLAQARRLLGAAS